MSNAYYPMQLIDFCMKYDKYIYISCHPGLVKYESLVSEKTVKFDLVFKHFPHFEFQPISSFNIDIMII
jgi:hypothetical protein